MTKQEIIDKVEVIKKAIETHDYSISYTPLDTVAIAKIDDDELYYVVGVGDSLG